MSDTDDFLPSGERRLTERAPIADVYVEMRREPDNEVPDWAGSAVDINASGMALVLPPDLQPGERVYLSFQLDELAVFEAVPGMVVRQDFVGVGAVRFEEWTETDQLALISYLQAKDSPPDPPA